MRTHILSPRARSSRCPSKVVRAAVSTVAARGAGGQTCTGTACPRIHAERIHRCACGARAELSQPPEEGTTSAAQGGQQDGAQPSPPERPAAQLVDDLDDGAIDDVNNLELADIDLAELDALELELEVGTPPASATTATRGSEPEPEPQPLTSTARAQRTFEVEENEEGDAV